ncbi:MAG: hypothetical protein J5I92_07985 [Thiogranum sp.]|nr:hypothetical protein [Thiogranum sp.]
MRMISKKLMSYLMAGALAVASLSVPMVAGAGTDPYGGFDTVEPTGGEMLADAFLVRPFMLVGTVLTTATFIVTLPFSLLGGNVGDAAETLVLEPAKYTFVRPLGEM